MLPTEHGEFRMIAYESEVDGGESHVALVFGDVAREMRRCRCGCIRIAWQGMCSGLRCAIARRLTAESLRMIAEAGRGALVYLHNGTKGFGIDRSTGAGAHRVVFHREQRARERTGERSERTLRQVGLGGQILSDLGIRKIRLLTNTPTHVPALQGFGIEIVEQVPVEVGRTAKN